MIFSSYGFIFIFLPVTLAGFYILRHFSTKTFCKLWLVAASLVFYAQGDLRFLPILGGTVVFNYIFSRIMNDHREKKFLKNLCFALLLGENLGLLLYFKYTNFFLENAAALLGTEYIFKNIILPLGISFYTFQLLAFCVDCYKGKDFPGNFLDFCVFATFFPQLVVGPIIRRGDMREQLEDEGFSKPNYKNICLAVMFFSIGCAKKILLADAMITHAQSFYDAGGGNFFESWGAALAYTFAYYFDFSAYADMAVGLGLLFNVQLPANFNSPYQARDFADFWRRWNITVTNFFYEYIFRGIFRFGDGGGKLILATMVTFAVSGLWHGAAWHYVLWGAVNGVLVCASNILTLKRVRIPKIPGIALTFLIGVLVRVLFDAADTAQAFSVYESLFDLKPLFSDSASFWAEGAAYISENYMVIALVIVSAIICFGFKNNQERFKDFTPRWYHPAAAGALIAASLFFMGDVSSFLYFQF